MTATGQRSGLGRSSALMASGSLVSRVLGVARNAMLGFCIGGMGGASSAFQTANTLPNSIFILLQSGVLTAILIPQLTRALRREDGGTGAINALLTVAFVIVGGVTLLATALAGPLITLIGLQGTARDLGIAFAYLCLPQIFFYSAYAIWSQVLNVKGVFGITMWTPALANVVQIAGMAVFLSQYVGQQPAERWTPGMVWLLAGTSTLGIVIQAVALIPPLLRTGIKWRPSFKLRGHGFGTSTRFASWMILAVVIAQIGGFVNQAAINLVSERARLAGTLVPGLNVYLMAFTIFMVPHGIVTVSVLTALLPRMTRSSQTGDAPALRHDIRRGLSVPTTAMIPMTAAAIALAVPGCALLNPGLDEASVRAIALTFSLMALGLVPYGVAGLAQRYATAREAGRTYLWFTGIVTGVQVLVAASILALPDAVGVTVVAAGQTLGNAIAATLFLVVAQRQVGGLDLAGVWGVAAKLIVAAAMPAALAWAVVEVLLTRLGYHLPTALVALLAGGLVFGLGFYALARALRISELAEFAGPLGKRLFPAAR